MTIKEYQKKLDKRITEVNVKNQLVRDCINDTHANYVARIFEEGKRASGRIIGKYSPEYQKRRRKKGRLFPTINYVDEGTLQTDVANSLTVMSDFKIVNGVKNTGSKKSQGVSNSEKVDFLIQRFGKDVWELGKTQRKDLSRCMTRVLIKIMTK